MSDQVSSLEREIEQTRERLAATIDQLLHRASPKTIAKREADREIERAVGRAAKRGR